MSYFKNQFSITPEVFQQMEGLRKSFVGELMTREQALDLIKAMGLPSESPKLWELLLKYQVLIKKGDTRWTRYRVPQDMYAKKTLDKLEDEFYNGKRPKKNKKKEAPRIKDEITGKTILSPEFCINYLKQRGYAIFKLSPNLVALQKKFTMEFLLESMDAELV